MLYEYSLENSVHVTYLIAGQPKDHSLPFQLQLVSSDKLEQVKQSFEKIVSIHVHSLSKSHPVTVSDLYRMESNTDFSFSKCGVVEYPSKIEMKSKIKHMEIVKPALPPMEKPTIKKSPKKEVKSENAGKITSFTTSKKSNPSPKKSTPVKKESHSSDDEEDIVKKKHDDLILDEESDEEMKDDDKPVSTPSPKKKDKKKESKKSTSDKKKSPKPKTQTNTLDKFTSSPIKSSTIQGERPTKRVKQIVSVKNEKGYLVSKEVWTDVPLTDEEIKHQEEMMNKVKKELSSDDDEEMKDIPTDKTDKKKKEPASKQKAVTKASASGTKQQSISSFFKKK